jgi:hypothetical protein
MESYKFGSSIVLIIGLIAVAIYANLCCLADKAKGRKV